MTGLVDDQGLPVTTPPGGALIEVQSICTATVVETWTLRVPEAMAAALADDPDGALELLDRLGEDGVEFLACDDEVSDERDRTLIGLRTFDADGNPTSSQAVVDPTSAPPPVAWQLARAAAGRTPR